MGCDIHPVLEQKMQFKDGTEKWVGLHHFPYYMVDGKFISPLAQNRNYKLFGLLAGVRTDSMKVKPKGMPDDASELALLYLGDNEDYHSHSYCTIEEWVQACWQCERDGPLMLLKQDPEDRRLKYPYSHYLDLDVDNYEDGRDRTTKFRMVFAFDN